MKLTDHKLSLTLQGSTESHLIVSIVDDISNHFNTFHQSANATSILLSVSLSHCQATEVKRILLRSVSYGEPLKNMSKKCAVPYEMGFDLTKIRLSAEGFSIQGGAEVSG